MDKRLTCKSASAEETRRLGAALARHVQAGDVVLLSGDLGAGKTQFSQGLAGALGVSDEVTSPTFNILLTYEGVAADGGPLVLNHFDLYRLEKPEQLVDIDFAGVLESGGVCLIEWADRFPQAMPEDCLSIEIRLEGADRSIQASASGARSQELLAQWRQEQEAFTSAVSGEVGDSARREATPEGSKPNLAFQGGAQASDDDAAHTATAHTRAVGVGDRLGKMPAAPLGDAFGAKGLPALDGSRSFVLVFDTSNEVIAVGLGRLDVSSQQVEPIATCEVPAHRASNTQLLPVIDELTREAGISRSQVACIACGRGPGSFTGVRICMATAKGLAMALECSLYGVSTPDSIAWKLWADGVRGELAVVADAMRKEVYPVRYLLGTAGAIRQNTDVVMKAEQGVEFIGAPDIITGDGLAKYHKYYRAVAPLAPESQWTPTGAGLLLALQAAWQSGELDPFDVVAGNPAFALPVYTRLSDAEENERIRLADANPRDLATGVQHKPLAPVQDHGQVSYRPMNAAQAAAVAQLESELMGTDAWNESMVLDELPRRDRIWWAACSPTGELVGYAGALVMDGQMQILKIGTRADYQRQGIAQRLLAHAAEDARALGAETATLEVRAGNSGALAFYERLGFTPLGRRPRYYSDREDALILEGPLPQFEEEHTVGGMAIRHLDSPMGASVAHVAGKAAPTQEGVLVPAPTAGVVDAGTVPVVDERPLCHAETQEAPFILAIESSCDETAAAVVDGQGRLLSDVVASQIDFHKRFGGVVPEIASRKHIEAICGVAQEGLDKAAASLGRESLRFSDLDAIAATYAPGLVGALVVGVAFAKGVAWGADIPFVGVNHLEGHLYANKIATPDLEPPFVASLVSGGHTMLVHVRDWGSYETLGSTIDDAVGEAFDKVAKALGLGYPGGPVISRLAAQGNPKAVRFPRAMMHSGDLRFSLSGLKTAVITYLQKEREAGRELQLPDIAASFQQAVIDVQVAKARDALEQTGAREFCLGGGVAANPALREAYERMCAQMGVRLTLPPLSSCTDNAGMIALVALDRYAQGKAFDLTADVKAHAPLDEAY